MQVLRRARCTTALASLLCALHIAALACPAQTPRKNKTANAPAAQSAAPVAPAQEPPAASAVPAAPAVTALDAATPCAAYSATPNQHVSGTAPFTFAASGVYPTWLAVDRHTGALSGTPPKSDATTTWAFNLVVTDADGAQSTAPFKLKVNGAPADCKDAAPAAAPQPATPADQCEVKINSALNEGTTKISGSVNPDVVSAATTVAICRHSADDTTLCQFQNQVDFEPLSGATGYSVAPDKTGKFSMTLQAPLVAGDLVNAVLLNPGKQCADTALATVIADKKAAAGTEDESGGKGGPGGGSAPPAKPAKPAPTGHAAAPAHAGAAAHASAPALVAVAYSTSAAGPPAQAQAGPPAPAAPSAATPASDAAAQDTTLHSSLAIPVTSNSDWGKVRIYFMGGILVANDDVAPASSSGGSTTTATPTGGSLSTAHEFFALRVDTSWSMPYCSAWKGGPAWNPANKAAKDKADTALAENAKYGETCNAADSGFLSKIKPGLFTFFDTRLTAIPVSSTSTSNANSTGTTEFISTQKTAIVEVGSYLPWLLERWRWNRAPNSLFIAPVGKVGFDTLTGATSNQVITNTGSVGTLNYERLYNYYAFGGRVGHFTMASDPNGSPELQSYFDVTLGRYSNLESYVCDPGVGAKSGFSTATGSLCSQAYGTATSWVDSLKRPYRLDFEGMLKIPLTPLLVGFNANIGQHTYGTQKIDPAFAAPDDLRLLFATKFDVGKIVSAIGGKLPAD